ncbi:hypothetical protein F5Y06DRAFT_264041 [Hypoxylon sp. FL0890]|nr:hypothetical protein F5Y06DRAFT_264041 [Hypoxylon sp. FL0890]
MPQHRQSTIFFEFSSSCINFVFNLIVLILLQRTVWGLNMSHRRKIRVSLIFSLGISSISNPHSIQGCSNFTHWMKRVSFCPKPSNLWICFI